MRQSYAWGATVTIEELRAKVGEWDLCGDHKSSVATAKYSFILNQLEHHAAKDWKVYLPAEHPDFSSDYLVRLARWIGSLNNENDQKLLLEYATYISFFCHDDFTALYQTAFNREVMRWVAQQMGTSLSAGGANNFNDAVQQEVHNKTWFCPITDSMDINEFCKVNHLKGISHRPSFAPLQALAEDAGNPDTQLLINLQRYMVHPSDSHPSLERLVLLEDIVGSSDQCIATVRWAIQSLGKPVLFIPLILCPNGVTALRAEERNSGGRLAVCPVVELNQGDLLGPGRQRHDGWPISGDMEALANRCSHDKLLGLNPFGYRTTGCSIATFANTPDNTLPLVHHKPSNGAWEPLFPRVHRD